MVLSILDSICVDLEVEFVSIYTLSIKVKSIVDDPIFRGSPSI